MVESHPRQGAADDSTENGDKDISGPLYKSKDWLYEQYVIEEKTAPVMAEKADCSRTTIYDWLQRHDIDRTRGSGYRPNDPEKYRDSDWMERKYWDEKSSASEIADICDCSKQTILRWLHEHNIDVRGRSESAKVTWEDATERKQKVAEKFRNIHSTLHPFIFTDTNGYARAGSSDGNGGSIFVKLHSLLAIAEGTDPHEIFSVNKVVHHKNKIPWDNRPENIEVLTPAEHSRLHANELWGNNE